MSRYRKVFCLIWNDDKFPFISDDCQLVWFHIQTTPLSTPFGIYKASLEALASEKRWLSRRYRKAFQKGIAKDFWKYDKKHHVIFIPKFLSYNPPDNPNVLKSWGKVFTEIPDCGLKDEFYQSIKGLVEGYGEGFKEAFAEGFPEPASKGIGKQEQYQEQYQEQDTPPIVPPKGGRRNGFDSFWTAYPKKKSKGQAEKVWKKINPDEQLLATMLATIERAKTSEVWTKDNGRFIPHPATWLNARGWEDEQLQGGINWKNI